MAEPIEMPFGEVGGAKIITRPRLRAVYYSRWGPVQIPHQRAAALNESVRNRL